MINCTIYTDPDIGSFAACIEAKNCKTSVTDTQGNIKTRPFVACHNLYDEGLSGTIRAQAIAVAKVMQAQMEGGKPLAEGTDKETGDEEVIHMEGIVIHEEFLTLAEYEGE